VSEIVHLLLVRSQPFPLPRFRSGAAFPSLVLTVPLLPFPLSFHLPPPSPLLLSVPSFSLVVSTAAASLCLFTSLLGYAGIILNNRTFLAIYTLFLWFCFALIVTPGYITYKNFAFNLEGKINRQWSRDLGEQGRLKIQNQVRFLLPRAHAPSSPSLGAAFFHVSPKRGTSRMLTHSLSVSSSFVAYSSTAAATSPPTSRPPSPRPAMRAPTSPDAKANTSVNSGSSSSGGTSARSPSFPSSSPL
jgi:hypothetical protein